MIELSPNEYTIAKFLFESITPKDLHEISFELNHNDPNPSKGHPTFWFKKDTTKPTGYWGWDGKDVEPIAEKLLALGLIAFNEKMVGGRGETCSYCGKTSYSGQTPLRYYFMTDTQKEQFKAVQVKPIEIPIHYSSPGRPRKYKDDAERQRAYRERKNVTKQ